MNGNERNLDLSQIKGFICDMDGVIYHGNRVLPGVAEFLRWLHDENKEYLFLTNNSSRGVEGYIEKLERLGIATGPEDYLTSVDAAIDLLRRQKRRGKTDDITEISVADSAPGPQQQAEQSETRQAVRDAMAQLSPEYRQIVVLRFLQELSYEEIGAVLKLPPGTVKSRLNRAKSQLKDILSKSGNLFGAGSVIHTETKGKEARP